MGAIARDRATIVYRATNAVNGHSYIGFTTQGLSRRVQNHHCSAARGEGWLLHAAIRKYGVENIRFEVMRDFDGDEKLAKAYEIEAIAKYRPEYNISHGGDGGTVHPDTALKISRANRGRPSFLKGKKFSPEALAKFRATKAKNGKPAGNTGKKATPEKLEKTRRAALGKPSSNKGRTYSAEVRQRMSEAARNRAPRERTEEEKMRWRETMQKAYASTSRPVECLTDGKIFCSSRAADRYYGFRLGTVIKVIRGETKTTHSGMMFIRKDVKS